MRITQGDLAIRELTVEDFPLMLKWLTDSRVLEFYGGRDLKYTMDALKQHYTEPFEAEGYRVIIEYQGRPIGYGQVYLVCGDMYQEYDYPESSDVVFATDQFIGEVDHWNRGIGTGYMNLVCQYLKAEKQADAVILDPRKDNARAIRAYQKAGFQILQELPRHELFEGEHADCLLMERKL